MKTTWLISFKTIFRESGGCKNLEKLQNVVEFDHHTLKIYEFTPILTNKCLLQR